MCTLDVLEVEMRLLCLERNNSLQLFFVHREFNSLLYTIYHVQSLIVKTAWVLWVECLFGEVLCITNSYLYYNCTSELSLYPLIFLADVQQIAIDWITGNFYFVDHVSDRIFVCNQNGTVCVTLIELDLNNPKAIAVDPTSG